MARQSKKKDKIINAEFTDEQPSNLPVPLTEKEIKLQAIQRDSLIKAHLEHIETLGPEQAFDEIRKMTDLVQRKLLYRIIERENWLDSPDPNIRAEAQNFMTAMLDQSAKITHTMIQLYEALGLNERKGALPGGKDVPRLLIPSRSEEEFEKEFGEPQGNA